MYVKDWELLCKNIIYNTPKQARCIYVRVSNQLVSSSTKLRPLHVSLTIWKYTAFKASIYFFIEGWKQNQASLLFLILSLHRTSRVSWFIWPLLLNKPYLCECRYAYLSDFGAQLIVSTLTIFSVPTLIVITFFSGRGCRSISPLSLCVSVVVTSNTYTDHLLVIFLGTKLRQPHVWPSVWLFLWVKQATL